MPSTVKVISQTQREAASEILLESEVGLLRIRIHKVFRLRITERLKRQREAGFQIILIDENRLWKIQRLELLLIRQVTQVGRKRRRDTRRNGLYALKNIAGVQIQRTAVRCIRIARTASRKQQLPTPRSVRRIAQEIKSQQRMIVENPIRPAQHGLPVALRIPGKAQARLHVVGIRLDALLQTQRIVSCQRQRIWRRKLWREFNVVAHAQVQRKIRLYSPRVLKVDSQRLVGKTVIRIANSLNEILRNSQAIRLQSSNPWDGLLQAPGQRTENRTGNYLAGSERSKVIHAAIIHRERSREWNVIEVHAKLHAVLTVGQREIVGELVTLLGALNVGIRLAPEVCVAGNIDCRIRPARRVCIKVRQSPPRILKTEFVHFIVSECPRVLENSGDVAISLLRSSRVCVLSERLPFAGHFDTGYSAGAHVRS